MADLARSGQSATSRGCGAPAVTISPSLEREVRARLNHARVMAEASAGQVQIARTHPGTRMPTLAGPAILDRLLAALEKVTSDRQVRRWLDWADEQLREITHGPDRTTETPAQFRYRLCIEYEGQLAGVVARRELCTVTWVRKIRLEDGRNPQNGRKTGQSVPPTVDT